MTDLIISSIDGRIPATMDELTAGVGTSWSDINPMPVFDDAGDLVGTVDPVSGRYAPAPCA